MPSEANIVWVYLLLHNVTVVEYGKEYSLKLFIFICTLVYNNRVFIISESTVYILLYFMLLKLHYWTELDQNSFLLLLVRILVKHQKMISNILKHKQGFKE